MHFSTDLLDIFKVSAFINRLKLERRVQMDNTEFLDWNGCFVKGMISGGLRKISNKGMSPLLFGQAVHTGMKHLVLGDGLEMACERAIFDARESKLDMLLDPRRNTDSLIRLLTSYNAHVNTVYAEKLVPVELNGKKIVEETFSFPIGTIEFKAGELFPEAVKIDVWWSGILDLLTYLRNEIWVCDHKTTSVMGDKFVDDKVRSSQMLGYTYVGRLFQEQFTKPVRGVVINALALRSTGFEFKHFPIPMANWKIEEWQNETLFAIRNIIRQAVEFISTGEAVPIREHCVTKYGQCKFFDLCEAPPMVRDRMLDDENLYVTNSWHPIE